MSLAPSAATPDEIVLRGEKRALALAVAGQPLAAVLDALARTIEEQSQHGLMASILLLDDDGAHLRHGAAPSLPAAYNAAIDGIAIGDGVGSCGTAAATGRTVLVTDIQRDPKWAAFKELAGAHGLAACWSTPIFSTEKDLLGTFALYHRVTGPPSARDLAVVDLLAPTAALVVERDRLARAQAKSRVAAALFRSEAQRRVNDLLAQAPAAVAMLRGPSHVFEMANERYRALVGGRAVVGSAVRDALPELSGQGILELLDRVFSTGEPYVGKAMPVTLRRNGGDELCFFDFVYQPTRAADGAVDGIACIAFEVSDLVRAREAAEVARARAEESERALATELARLRAH